MDLTKIVGKEIKVRHPVTNGILGRATKTEKWLVIAAYPHHVMAIQTYDSGFIARECFCLGELVQIGAVKRGR